MRFQRRPGHAITRQAKMQHRRRSGQPSILLPQRLSRPPAKRTGSKASGTTGQARGLPSETFGGRLACLKPWSRYLWVQCRGLGSAQWRLFCQPAGQRQSPAPTRRAGLSVWGEYAAGHHTQPPLCCLPHSPPPPAPQLLLREAQRLSTAMHQAVCVRLPGSQLPCIQPPGHICCPDTSHQLRSFAPLPHSGLT